MISGETIRAIIPLLLSGLAVAVANKAGVFNIGVDGQIIMGAVSSLLVGTLIEMPPILHGIVAIFVGVIAGGLWGVLVAGLKTKFGINEVISSIMLNYIALYFSHILIKNFAGSGRDGTFRDDQRICWHHVPFLERSVRWRADPLGILSGPVHHLCFLLLL